MNNLKLSRLRALVLIVPLVLLLQAQAPFSGPVRWQPLGPPDGATVLAVAFDPVDPSIVYAGTAGGGIAKSVDGGRTWSPASRGLSNATILSLAVDPADPRQVYAGTETGFYRSHDRGATWIGSELKLQVLAIAVDSRRAGSLNVATQHGFYRSTDGGLRWAFTSSGVIPDNRFLTATITAAPSQPRTLYASFVGFRSGVFRSDDSGRTWRKVLQGQSEALAVDPLDPDRVYAADGRLLRISTDGGLTWSRHWLSGWVFQLITHRAQPQRLVALTDHGIAASEDRGESWRSVAHPNRQVWDLAVNPAHPETWLAGTSGGGVIRSDDGGLSWAPSTAGLVNFNAEVVRVVPERGAIFTGGASGLYRSRDGGRTWRRVLRDVPVLALAVDPTDPDTLYAGAANTGPVHDPGRLILKSEDGGNTWHRSTIGNTRLPIRDLLVLPSDPQTVFAGAWTASEGYLFRSQDGGATWAAVSGIGGVQDLEIDPTDPDVIYATQGHGFLRSHDAGRTWRGRTVGEPAPGQWARRTRQIAVSPAEPNRLAVIDPYSLFLSEDEGRSWQKNREWGPDFARSVVFDPVRPGLLFVGTVDQVFWSADFGATWRPFSDGWPGVVANDLAFDPADPRQLYAATSAAGLFRVTVP